MEEFNFIDSSILLEKCFFALRFMYLEPSITSLLMASVIPRLTNQCLKLLNLLALDMLVLQF